MSKETEIFKVRGPDGTTCQVEWPLKGDSELDQDEEWCWVHTDEGRRRVRLHDYHELYEVPGLYEHVFYERLNCNSPEMVCGLLKEALDGAQGEGLGFADLKVLDVGAGNGMVGELLHEMGARDVVGVDIIAEAAEATERDRPGVYDGYHVADLTDLPQRTRVSLERRDLNCLTTVAALGFGDIPPLAFAEAYNLITNPGWLAFNIKDQFVGREDPTGFAGLIHRMAKEGLVDVRARRRYRHRDSLAGEPLHYVALVATKRADLPESWLASLGRTG